MAIPFSVNLLAAALITTTALLLTSAADYPAPSHPPTLPTTLPPSFSPSPSSSTSPPSFSPSPSPSASPPLFSPSPSPSASPPAAMKEKQLENIFDALVGAGDFGGWASLLSSANPSSLPITATLFIPSNEAISRLLVGGPKFDPLILPYHIVPQRLTFSDLRHLHNLTRLPTLLSDKFIVVTNNSPSNFTLDGARIVQADAFLNAAFALHAIDKILDYSVYGGGGAHISPAPAQGNSSEVGGKRRPPARVVDKSGAWCCCSGITVIVLSCFWFVFVQE